MYMAEQNWLNYKNIATSSHVKKIMCNRKKKHQKTMERSLEFQNIGSDYLLRIDIKFAGTRIIHLLYN